MMFVIKINVCDQNDDLTFYEPILIFFITKQTICSPYRVTNDTINEARKRRFYFICIINHEVGLKSTTDTIYRNKKPSYMYVTEIH